MAAESFVDLSEFGFTTEFNSPTSFDLSNMDNIFFDVIPLQEPTLVSKTSPFHESDSGLSDMSEEFINPGSVDSTGSEQSRGGETKMLDELVESPLLFSPFCEPESDGQLQDLILAARSSNNDTLDGLEGADRDLADYFSNENSYSSVDLADFQAMVQRNSTEETVTLNKENKIINYRPKTRSASKGKTTPKGPNKFPKVVLKQCNADIKPKKHDSSVTVLEDKSPRSGLKSIKVLKVIKTPATSEEDTATQVVAALDDRNRKNAINAKVNREKKKAYVTSLEDELNQVKDSNAELQSENDKLKIEKDALAAQVEYFKSVLANQSTLSKVLNTMENLKGVRLSSSITGSSRKRALNADHSYGSKNRKMDETEAVSESHSKSSAGVCLHVHEETVSLEFCSHCSRMAKGAEGIDS